MNDVNQLLLQLYQELQSVKSPLATLLNTGISREEINEAISGIGVRLPEELYLLYEWRNGTRDLYERRSGEVMLIPMGTLYPIKEAVSEYEANMGADQYWKKDMFPVLIGGDGEYYLINCGNGNLSTKAIYFYTYMNPSFNVIITKYDSFESLIKTTIECYKQKAYYFKDTDPAMLEIDFLLEKKISKEYNPQSQYWKLYD